MPLVCMQCALEAALAGRAPATAVFEQTPEEHEAMYHPNAAETLKRRKELEKQLADRMAAGANARNN